MYFKYINNSKYVNKIEELYLNSFPEDERFPFGYYKNVLRKIIQIYMQFWIMTR